MRSAKIFLACIFAASTGIQLGGCAVLDEEQPIAVPAVDDATLARNIKSAIADGAGTGTAMNVNVLASGGAVRLTPNPNSPQASLRAEQIARSIEGVRSVSNELNVPPRPDDSPASQELRRP